MPEPVAHYDVAHYDIENPNNSAIGGGTTSGDGPGQGGCSDPQNTNGLDLTHPACLALICLLLVAVGLGYAACERFEKPTDLNEVVEFRKVTFNDVGFCPPLKDRFAKSDTNSQICVKSEATCRNSQSLLESYDYALSYTLLPDVYSVLAKKYGCELPKNASISKSAFSEALKDYCNYTAVFNKNELEKDITVEQPVTPDLQCPEGSLAQQRETANKRVSIFVETNDKIKTKNCDEPTKLAAYSAGSFGFFVGLTALGCLAAHHCKNSSPRRRAYIKF